MINTVPSPQTPICLDVILGADNRPALYRSHTCAWMRNRAGREGAAVVFSQSVWSSDRQTFFFFPSSNLPHSAARSRTARAGGKRFGNTQATCYTQLVRARAWILVFMWADGGLMAPDNIFSEGTVLMKAMPELLKRQRTETTAFINLPVMLTSTMPVRVPMPLVASQTYVPARS